MKDYFGRLELQMDVRLYAAEPGDDGMHDLMGYVVLSLA